MLKSCTISTVIKKVIQIRMRRKTKSTRRRNIVNQIRRMIKKKRHRKTNMKKSLKKKIKSRK